MGNIGRLRVTIVTTIDQHRYHSYLQLQGESECLALLRAINYFCNNFRFVSSTSWLKESKMKNEKVSYCCQYQQCEIPPLRSQHRVKYYLRHSTTIKKTFVGRKFLEIPKRWVQTVSGRTDNTMDKRKQTKGQTMIHKKLHRKLKIEQHEPH